MKAPDLVDRSKRPLVETTSRLEAPNISSAHVDASHDEAVIHFCQKSLNRVGDSSV
jgi:hypothetical protein